MSSLRRMGMAAAVALVAAGTAWAQQSAPAPKAAEPTAQEKLEKRLADLEGVANTTAPAMPGGNRIVAGDNAWMLTSSALVLMMTGPGLALFYGGLVRRKNVLSTFMHSMFLMGLMSLLWVLGGYSIAFAEGNAFFGNPMKYFLLKDVGADPQMDYATTIPHTTWMLFQLMFAIITPALISGAFAERIKFSAMLLFTVLWAFLVYFPMAHMVWGKGGLFNWFFDAKIPALDFAGGTVVHISSGVSALVCAIVVGKRLGFPGQPMPPHNVTYSMIGAGLLWVGWFGFNAGSALNAGATASSAFAATHFASAAAMLSWTAAEWWHRGKPSALGAVSGLVAGLVVVTPAAGFVSVGSAVLMGLIGGAVCFFAASVVKAKFGYDDSLDAFGVHGVGGTLGALLTGIFADAKVNSAIETTYKVGDKPVSLAGGMGQFMNQLYAVLITWVIAAVATFVILKIVNAVTGLRPTEQEEQQGLDVSLHGEQAYNN